MPPVPGEIVPGALVPGGIAEPENPNGLGADMTALLLVALPWLGAGQNPAQDPPAPRFEDHPVAETFTGRPAPPLLATPRARRYRTVIRRAAEAGPNFAGRYTVAQWGCGSTCRGFAIIDARTGEVHFHPEILRVIGLPYQAEGALQFRPDSRLLVIAGATEGPGGHREGKFFYEWKDGRFSLLARSEVRLDQEAPPLPPGTTLDDLCEGLYKNSHECAEEIERYQLRRPENARRVTRSGARLRLRLADGRWLSVEDDTPDDEVLSVVHHFREYLPEIGYFVLHRQFYEGHDYLLVEDSTGRRYELHAVPVVSPDGRRLVTASDGFTGGYVPNVVKIWRLRDGHIELEQAIAPRGWGPSHPEWIDDRTIRLRKNHLPVGEGPPPWESVWLRRNGEWHLDEDEPDTRGSSDRPSKRP